MMPIKGEEGVLTYDAHQRGGGCLGILMPIKGEEGRGFDV